MSASSSQLEKTLSLALTAEHLNKQFNDKLYVIHKAICLGHENNSVILAQNALLDLTVKDEDGNEVLSFTVFHKNYLLLDYLLSCQERFDVNATNDRGETALSLAAMNGDIRSISLLLTFEGIDIEHRDDLGLTPFQHACDENHLHVAKLLLAQQPTLNINAANNDGVTALISACDSGDNKIVAFLLSLPRINIEHADNVGDTALTCATRQMNIPLIKYLLPRQKNLLHKTKDNGTHLDLAFQSKNRQIVTVYFNVFKGRTLHAIFPHLQPPTKLWIRQLIHKNQTKKRALTQKIPAIKRKKSSEHDENARIERKKSRTDNRPRM